LPTARRQARPGLGTGCSTGEEAYSIASLDEQMKATGAQCGFKIFATDIGAGRWDRAHVPAAR
jgi:chemotaxis methyl-accepting protein methylase